LDAKIDPQGVNIASDFTLKMLEARELVQEYPCLACISLQRAGLKIEKLAKP